MAKRSNHKTRAGSAPMDLLPIDYREVAKAPLKIRFPISQPTWPDTPAPSHDAERFRFTGRPPLTPEAARGRRGGHAGAGKPKRPHSELIRRAVEALAEHQLQVSAKTVRLLLKSRWQTLALEWDDPLREIVGVQVREKGPVVIEYTARWAATHRGKRFVELDASALGRALNRAPKAK